MGNSGKAARQKLILEIVEAKRIGSLTMMQEELSGLGFAADESTLSRDIAEIHIGKKDGYYQAPDRFDLTTRILPPKKVTMRNFVLSSEAVGNMVVINTIPGSANAVAIQVDSRKEKLDCAGTLAGDDTVFVLLRSTAAARRFLGWLQESQAQAMDQQRMA